MNKDISLSQDELKVIVGILRQVQLISKDSKIVNPIIDKLDSFIDPVQPPQAPEAPITPEVVTP